LNQPSLLEPDESDLNVATPRHEGEERFFEMDEILEATAWAEKGGIAVHRGLILDGMKVGTKVRSGQHYHVMCLNRDTLIAWGRRNSQRTSWLQPPTHSRDVWHYDVFGGPARRMEQRMGIEELPD